MKPLYRTLMNLMLAAVVCSFACGGGGDGNNDNNPLDGGSDETNESGYTVSGTVKTADGSGIAGVSVSITGESLQKTTTTNDSGAYSFSDIANGTYMVIPALLGTGFTPEFLTVIVNGGNVTMDVFVSEGNNGDSGEQETVSVSVSNDVPPIISWTGGNINSLIVMDVHNVMSDYQWSITSPQGQVNAISSPVTYGVTPSGLVEETNSPLVAGREYRVTASRFSSQGNVVGYAYFTAQEGAGTTEGYRVSGAVVDRDRRSVEGAIVVLLDDDSSTLIGTTESSGDGSYEFTGVPDGTYYVTASHPSYVFREVIQEITVDGSDVNVSNFVGDKILD